MARRGPGADAAVPVPQRHRRWLWPVAAAAVAVIAVAIGLGLRTSAAPPTPVAPTPGTTATTTAPTVAVAVPVFHVAPVAGATGFGLVREFAPVSLPVGAGTEAKADAALALAVALPADNVNHYVAVWPPGTHATWVTLPNPEIGIALSGPGVTGLPEAAQRAAVQALVWTVTGVAGRNAPVPVTVSSGGYIFETVPPKVYKRPAAEQAFEEIAPLWIDAPYAGQSLSAASEIVVTGQACVFEGALAWELNRDGSLVSEGTTSATSGCPQQGSWSVDIGTLPPGTYEFRALAHSAKDGRVAAQNVVPFTVS